MKVGSARTNAIIRPRTFSKKLTCTIRNRSYFVCMVRTSLQWAVFKADVSFIVIEERKCWHFQRKRDARPVFAADASYILLAALQRLISGMYPAARHRVDAASLALVTFHILTGASVIYGGSLLFLALQAHWTSELLPQAAVALAAAALLHSASTLPLLRKIPGTRLLNVPIYVMVTSYNLWNALRLLRSPHSHQAFLLLWCGVSTFAWVRLFIYLFVLVTSSDLSDEGSYDVFYSVSLPYAGIFGVVVPVLGLGGEPAWIVALGAGVAVLAPLMVRIHKACVVIRDSSPCFRWVVQWVMDAANPVEYHGHI